MQPHYPQNPDEPILLTAADVIDDATASPAAGATNPKSPVQRRQGVWERLLDPRSIRALLALGGGLLVIGLVIWLAVQGFFTPPRVAFCMSAATIAALGGGWTAIRLTRYQTAGRAITLLACLVLPLNLWFFHAKDLITVDGHLWVAALFCCVLYAASALVLRERTFVYVLLGGLTMTGMLALADVGRIVEISAPAALLAGLGVLAIHVERAFPNGDGPFSRGKFGLAFFWSGHVLLGAGLALVLGAQITGGWLFEPVFRDFYSIFHVPPPEIVTSDAGRILALALVLAGMYAYVYSDVVVRRLGVYLYAATATLLWAEALAVDLLLPAMRPDVLLAILSLTALAAQFAQLPLAARTKYGHALRPLALGLSVLPVLLGISLYVRSTFVDVYAVWPYEATWGFAAAMLLAAAVSHVGSFRRTDDSPWLAHVYAISGGLAALLSAGAVVQLAPSAPMAFAKQAPWLLLVPIGYVVADRLTRRTVRPGVLALPAQALAAIIVILVGIEFSGEDFRGMVDIAMDHLALAATFAVAGIFYSLSAALHRDGRYLFAAVAAAALAAGESLIHVDASIETCILVYASVGWAILVIARLVDCIVASRDAAATPADDLAAIGTLARQRRILAPNARRLAICGHAILSLTITAAALIAFSQIMIGGATWSLFAQLVALAGVSAAAILATPEPDGRRWYTFTTVVLAATAFATMQALSVLTMWQKAEVFSFLVGIGLLIAGHVGWKRELQRRSHSDMTSLALLLGSLLAGTPVLLWTVVHRLRLDFTAWDVGNEVALVVLGVALLASGLVLRLRSTTVSGATLLALNLLTMALYVRLPERLQTTGGMIAIAGGMLFVVGILLSVYRDRLLSLPERVKCREGWFRILNWR